ncbi:MAG: sugar ABC transporter permease [Acholeplasmatales bacterium]|jgi:multiple sugar transport system permease protein|nr:sugar ABC transporter permease [Acholeplasmatales bacterium]
MKTKPRKKKKFNNSIIFLAPYLLAFTAFLILPVLIGILLSFTYFDLIQFPKFNGFDNYISLISTDDVFRQNVIPNTIKFSVIVGPVGYLLGFFLAWLLAQIPKKPRTVLALIIYSPSLTAGISMAVMWRVIFSGDLNGYLNIFLINLGFIDQPISWLTDPKYLLNIMIIVSVWSSMGVGFLAMLAGVLNTDKSIYEASYIDGVSTKFQEIFYITIPQMKPQMLFGAVMSIVSTFNAGQIGIELSGGGYVTPMNSGQLIVNHINDYGFGRFEMGYAAAISVLLLVMVYFLGQACFKLFGDKQ